MIKQNITIATAVLILILILILPLLLFHTRLSAGEKDEATRRHNFNAWLGAGILAPPQIDENGGPNLQRRYSWAYDAGVGYSPRLYKNLSAVIGVGANAYSYKYVADIVTEGPHLTNHAIPIRRTEKFLCFYASLSLAQKFAVAEKMFSAEAGVRFINTPSLLLGHGQSIQDSTGATRRFFNSEVDFDGDILAMYFLKFGTPLFKNTSGLSAHIVFHYLPALLGSGNFYITNTTKNSYGTLDIKGNGMGIELRYTF